MGCLRHCVIGQQENRRISAIELRGRGAVEVEPTAEHEYIETDIIVPHCFVFNSCIFGIGIYGATSLPDHHPECFLCCQTSVKASKAVPHVFRIGTEIARPVLSQSVRKKRT